MLSIVEQEAVTDEGNPTEPDLTVLKTNLLGVAYTAKLANFYFPKQPDGADRDRCLVITASLSGYIDHPGSPQYNASKWAVRGLMRSLRRTGPSFGMRVNVIAPWFIHTRILSDEVAHVIKGAGAEFAEVEDAASAVLHFASDKAINGEGLFEDNSKSLLTVYQVAHSVLLQGRSTSAVITTSRPMTGMTVTAQSSGRIRPSI